MKNRRGADGVTVEDCAEYQSPMDRVRAAMVDPGADWADPASYKTGSEEPPAEAPPELPPPPAPKSAPRRASPGRLLVATNPWAAIDHKGRPAGACPAEVGPRDENARTYVGARPAFGDVTRPAPRRAELYQRTERRDLVWEFQREPFEVPDTSYYRRKVRERELLDATKDYEAARALLSARHKDAAPPRWI